MTTAARARTVGLPGWVFVPAALGVAFVLLPLVAIVTKVDWANFGTLITAMSCKPRCARMNARRLLSLNH